MSQVQVLKDFISDENDDRLDGFLRFLDTITKVDMKNYSIFNTE